MTRSCMATGTLPVTMEPSEPKQIDVQIVFVGKVGSFQHHFILFTDNERQPIVTARYAGRVIEPASR